MEDGLSFELISDILGRGIQTWFVPGSSPSEWEPLQRRVPDAEITLIGVSPYDLNEQILCDYHANVVPLKQTIEDLWQSGVELQYSRHVISQYPMMYLRMLFPTAGRSQGVMGRIREQLGRLLGLSVAMEIEAGPVVPTGKASTKSEKISNWSQGRMMRRIAAMRDDFQGKLSFAGPKNLALIRMLRNGQQQGLTVVAVLPVSPAFTKAFLTPEVSIQFESALSGIQLSVPEAHWIRLDRESSLNSNDYFWDLVHMNMFGQKIATEIFLRELKTLSDTRV
jgi:hypothetical protein